MKWFLKFKLEALVIVNFHLTGRELYIKKKVNTNTHIAVIYSKVAHASKLMILWSSTDVNVFREHVLEGLLVKKM